MVARWASTTACRSAGTPFPASCTRAPVPVTTSRAATLSDVRPYPSAREPQALLPIIPPIVQRLCVLGSGPKRSPCGRAAACSAACTTPGSTTAVRASGSIDRTRDRCRLVSTTTPVPTALPAIEVPAPRAVSGTPSSRQTASAATISSGCRGRTTARGRTRYSEASEEYRARARPEPSTSSSPARRSASRRSESAALTRRSVGAAAASPGGRLVLAGLLRLVGLLLGVVHRAVRVLRRTVDRVEDQRVLAGVHEVVLRTCGHDDQVALRHLLGAARDAGLSGAADEGEDLVGVLVHLLADLPARWDRHDHQLGVRAGPEDAAEVRALLCLGRDGPVQNACHGR